jgi:hypothetical protein
MSSRFMAAMWAGFFAGDAVGFTLYGYGAPFLVRSLVRVLVQVAVTVAVLLPTRRGA